MPLMQNVGKLSEIGTHWTTKTVSYRVWVYFEQAHSRDLIYIDRFEAMS
jgi:hypothetical protein